MRIWFYLLLVGLIQVYLYSALNEASADTETGSDNVFVNDDVVCGLESGQWLPGEIRGQSRFLSFKSSLLKLKLQIKKAVGAKLEKLTAKKKTIQKLHKEGIDNCKNGPPAIGKKTPTPTPPAGGSPNPNPTPTPLPGCFDPQGNTTCFGIGQAGLSGNLSAGKTIWDQGSGASSACSGCHHESTKRNKTYQQVQDALRSIPQMAGVSASNADVADIVAYLNRFND